MKKCRLYVCICWMPVVLCISIFKSSLKHIIQCCVATHFFPFGGGADYPVITLFYCHNCALSKINYLIVPLDRRCLFCTLWFLLYREQSVSKIWPLKKCSKLGHTDHAMLYLFKIYSQLGITKTWGNFKSNISNLCTTLQNYKIVKMCSNI